MSEDQKKKYEIFDIDVMTVGLVGKGASDEEFLLLKSDNLEKGKILSKFLNRKVSEIMEKEKVSRAEVIGRLVKATGLKRDTINAVLDNTIGRPPNKRLIQMSEVLGVPFDTLRLLADADREGNPRNLEEDLNKRDDIPADNMEVIMTEELETSIETAEETQEDEVNVDELVETTLQEKGEGWIRKALTAMFSNPNETAEEPVTREVEQREDHLELVKSLYQERIEKAEQDRDALQKSVAEIQKELDDEKDRRAKMEWFEKAQPITTVPVKRMEIAEKLHAMSKLDSEMADWTLNLLKTVDAQLHEAGLFEEFGTTRYDDGQVDALAKAKEAVAKGDAENLREFLLNLPVEEQRRVVAGA